MTATVQPDKALTRKQRDSLDPERSKHLLATIAANVENRNLSDEAFRDFIRTSLPVAFADETPAHDDFSGGGYR